MTRARTDERRLRRWVAGATLGLGALALGACEVAGSVPVGGPGGSGGDEPPTSDTTVPEDTVPTIPPTSMTTTPTELGDGLSLSTQRQMLALVNEQRAAGRSCGSSGTFGPTGPLGLDLRLAEAAQGHSEDMAQNDFFSHTGSDGTSGADRIAAVGYDWRAWGENVAAGSPDAAATVAQWFDSPTHCATFMNPVFTEVGFGYDQDADADYVHYWTANLGTPA
jgi:uncharacterized protein YkwD